MSTQKVGYVGSREAELTVAVTFTDIIASFDLGIPQAPTFELKLPLVEAEKHDDVFTEMMEALVLNVLMFFRHSGVGDPLLTELGEALSKSWHEISTDDESDRTGSGDGGLLDAIRVMEPVDVFEVRFKLPEGIIPAIHQKVVTAAAERAGLRGTKLAAWKAGHVPEAAQGRPGFKPVHSTPPPTKLAPNFQTNHNPTTLRQNRPTLRDVIRKFRGQQNKKLTGPIFVLVYDVNGRPVGVRSIKGPGWQGIGGKIAYNPATPETFQLALGLRMQLKNEGIWVELKQSPTGTFYLRFKGPVSGEIKKIRVSDHERIVQPGDPRFLEERATDLDIGPHNGKGRDEALQFIRTARKDVAEVTSRGQKIEITVFVDPSRSDVQRLTAKHGVCRAWVSPDGQRLIAWDAALALHLDLAYDYLPLMGWSYKTAIPVELWGDRVVRVTDSSASGQWYHNPEVALVLSESPAIRRALGAPPSGIDYFDEMVVGSWTELMPTAKSAASFGPQHVPNTFWVVLDLGVNSLTARFNKTLTELEQGFLDGVRGISDTGQIVRMFGYRGAFLRMDAQEVIQLNKLSRVMYESPEYLTSKNLSALFRIWDKRPDTELGRRGVMVNFAQEVIKALTPINSAAESVLRSQTAQEAAGRTWAYTPVELSSPAALSRWLFQEFTRSWTLETSRPVLFTQDDITEAVNRALYKVGQLYSSEGEWLVKDGVLRIPPSSTLVVGLDPMDGYLKAKQWWDNLPEEEQQDEQRRTPPDARYRNYLAALKLDEALGRLRRLPFKVSFVDGPRLTQQLHELTVKHVTQKSAKPRLFTRSAT